MTTAPATASPHAAPPAPPNLRLAKFEDYPQIAALLRQCDLQAEPEADWKSVWLDHPLWPRLKDCWPIGWVLEDSGGAIVGCVTNVPSLYHFKGRELLCANGRAWAAMPAYRGFSLILMDEYFNQDGVDLFINTTVGPMAVGILGELSNRVPLGDWESISYWITSYRAFAAKALEKMNIPLPALLAPAAGAALKIKDAFNARSLPDAPGGYAIDELSAFDARFDAFWRELLAREPNKLLAMRDRATLAWHFAIPIRRSRLRIYIATKEGHLRAYLVVKRHDSPGGMTRSRVVDFQTLEPQDELLGPLLKAAIGRCRTDGIAILDHLARGLPKMKTLDELAPYRQKFRNWPFYFKAPAESLAAKLSDPTVWDPSLYDGDASFE